MSSSNTSPDAYLEDLPNNSTATDSQTPNKRRRSPSAAANNVTPPEEAADSGVPKPKRIACVICRKRKLKCDGLKPSCSTCKRLGHDCAYDEVRRKSGPKRGYVKALEERLKQVEQMLKTTQEPPVPTPTEIPRPTFGLRNGNSSGFLATPNGDIDVSNPTIAFSNERDAERWHLAGDSPQPVMDDIAFDANMNMNMNMTMDPTNFTWEMIGLGLDEPLPPQETIDELHQIYFEKIHPSLPMIHKYRYLAAMNLAPNQRPPVCLRYAMWTLACSVTEKYMDLKEHFYQRARKYVEQDYLKGHGEHMISVGHAQTHILLCSYEFKMMYFPRAWMSTGSAVRLSQMMGLHRLDGAGLDVKQCLPPPRDWTEREERRRTFWMAFCEDRYASIGTGWPMTVDEKDILTNLPASEEAFEKSKPEQTQTLQQSFNPSGASGLSSFGGVVLMAALFGRNLVHLHRPDADDRDDDLNGEFWKRHRQMDNILLNTSLSLPNHLKLPAGLSSANIVFTNMNIHTSTICLHQAAIYKADKNRLPASVSKESKIRCITAANEISSIMRMISHMDLSAMNPFISFCLYVAARVFVQYLKSRPDDNATGDALGFLLQAMNAMKLKNPLTESFLVQLDVDLEGLGLKDERYKTFIQGYAMSGSKAPAFGAQLEAGPDGGIDQCNFMRIVDEQSPVSDSPIAPVNSAGEFHRNSKSSTQSGNSNPNGGYFGDNLNDNLNWLPQNGLPTRPTAPVPSSSLPVTMVSHFSMQAHLNPYGQDLDMELSETGPSDRPTPTSSAPSDGRSNLQPGKSQSSNHSSFEASPASSHQAIPDQNRSRTFYSSAQEYSSIPLGSTGLTPGNAFSMPETPGRDFTAPGSWDMSTQGLTPIGEGVLRELMGIGPMDMGWDNPS